jgi:hypothetical protein
MGRNVVRHGPRWPYALIQVSCAIRLNPREPATEGAPYERWPGTKIFKQVECDLRHFTARAHAFHLDALYPENPATGEPENIGEPENKIASPKHTLLDDISRHRVVGLPEYFSSKDQANKLPSALSWPERDPKNPAWSSYLRAQIAHDDLGSTDTNDWLINCNSAMDGHDPAGELSSLRKFFAYLFAQRRQWVFASNVSDRGYNIWLPPALLVPTDGRGQNMPAGAGQQDAPGAFAMLPFISLSRLPQWSAWRPTMVITVLLIPVSAAMEDNTWTGKLTPRPLSGRAEARRITSAFQGSMSHAFTDAQESYRCAGGGLREYLADLGKGECSYKDCPCFKCPRPAAGNQDDDDIGNTGGDWTIRKYLEAVLLAAITSAPQTRWARPEDAKEEEGLRQRWAASEAGRAVRLSSVSSTLLLARDEIVWGEENQRYIPIPRIRPAGRKTSRRPGADRAQIAGLPGEARLVLRVLADTGHLPTDSDRVDDLSMADGERGMTWRLPLRARSIVTVRSVRDDHFPGVSALNSFARIGVMVMAAATIREVTQALLHETARTPDSQDLAHLEKNLLIELEEVYDADIAWPTFARFYRSLREHLDLEDEHRRVRERVQSLSAAISRESAIREDNRARGIGVAAAAFALAVLLMTAYAYSNASNHAARIWVSVIPLTTAIFGAGAVWITRPERLSKRTSKAMTALAIAALAVFLAAGFYFVH